ncbi:MAG: hypothetical protein CBC47_00395 [Alphaproteobacteria bacterium TMED87]|nr:MAG: hypothetical protein CBC47_00395 [Alphaproteobacteria bacterium TMED87]|tara:strand:+ start:2770 stop:3639 length:870 start_codon:yes stop_codon:yes gene_type:complete
MIKIEQIGFLRNQLGEGPLWDDELQCFFWIDSLKGEIWRLDKEDEIRRYITSEMIGSLAIIDDDMAIVALRTGLYLFSFSTQSLSKIWDLKNDQVDLRLNDGKTDRQGNFIVGSMCVKDRRQPKAALYRINSELRVEILEEDVIVTNGPCFSPNGSTFYFNDGRRRILAYDYDPKGPLKNKRIFFDGSKYGTSSDGATVASDGNIWTALTGSHEIGCISPSGDLITRIPMPVKLPSSVMFGGTGLNELFVTSISNSGNRVSKEHLAGSLFKITNINAQGIAEQRFRLSV